MIVVVGGIKGGVGKTTIATTLAAMRVNDGKNVILIDADEQSTSTNFVQLRNQSQAKPYDSIQSNGKEVREVALHVSQEYDDVIIDVSGKDTVAQRAALLISSIYLVPYLPATFDIWTLEQVGSLIKEVAAFNRNLKAVALLNKSDARGSQNDEAIAQAAKIPELITATASLGNRKAFRNAAAVGLSVTEMKLKDKKAIAEVNQLYQYVFGGEENVSN